MKYADLIKGKRIIFVGGCPIIKGQRLGQFIDNYDIVVKTNGSVFLQGSDYFRDYGHRIGVLYCNVQFAREMRPLPVKKFRERGIKWLCFKTLHDKDMNQYRKNIKVRDIRNVINDVHKTLPGALMGAFIFTDLLQMQPKELFVTGIDFFASKKRVFEVDNYREYLTGYLPKKIQNQGNRINIGKKEDGHNMLENTMYIHDLFQKHNNFKMSEELQELMHGVVSGEIKQV